MPIDVTVNREDGIFHFVAAIRNEIYDSRGRIIFCVL